MRLMVVVTGSLLALLPASAAAASYAPDRVVVKFAGHSGRLRAAAARATGGALLGPNQVGGVRVLRIGRSTSVATALARLRRRPGVRYAVPDYEARASVAYVPNDPGHGKPGDWQAVQWNFVGPFGIDAPDAWGHLIAAGAPGGRGVLVAVLDTGVAYENHGRFVRSPDFAGAQFAPGYDFVSHTKHPDDHNGHGTHVAGTIAEATNNAVGLTGLAYGARIMPVRVLDSQGEGDAATIAAGVIYATRHGARVINLSLEFSSDVKAHDIPELLSALAYAHNHGVFIAGASGNEGTSSVAYPARARYVVSVGATTEHGCASDFSNTGRRLDLVAPGGGSDADLRGDPNCHPTEPPGHDIFQITFTGQNPHRFGTPGGYEGTSMAAPHVSATAALVIASRVLGPRPSPDAVFKRLKATSRKLGVPGDTAHYGAGLIDASAATDPLIVGRPVPGR